MEKVKVYHANGATFTCTTEERLKNYLAAGWTKEPSKKGKKAAESKSEEGKEA